MELLTILAADYANISQEGKLNVMGIFKDIYATQFPAQHPSMYLIVKLQAELGEFDDDRTLTIKLLDEDGQELMKLTGPLKMQKPSGGRRPEANAILQIANMVFPHAGRYEFRVFVDKDSKGSLAIDLAQLPVSAKAIEKQQE